MNLTPVIDGNAAMQSSTLRCASRLIACLILSCVLGSSPLAAQTEEAFQLHCRDGYQLDGKILTPTDEQRGDNPERVIILNHGSGQQPMDQDLTSVTKGGKENLFFRDIANSLAEAGFTVIRYHKRSFQVQMEFRRDPSIRDNENVQAFVANPLKYFVDDCLDCVALAEEKFPEAEIYLLGHSVGTYVSLQAAAQSESIKGVALIGFYATSVEYLAFEQHIARPAVQFGQLDANHDGLLDADELAVESDLAKAVAGQKTLLDLDQDDQISLSEYQAASLSSLFVSPLLKAIDFRKQEAAYPRVTDILKDASFKVAFFQGLWDNQTPAYNAQAVELLAKNVWSKDYRFHYFPKLGHALDQRTDYSDQAYDVIDPAALRTMTDVLDEYFR